LEAGSSSGGPATAAPKRSALGVVIAIVIAVAATAAVMDLVVVPALKPAPSGDFIVHLMTFDVGYDRSNYNPQWEVKAGQLIVVTMNNSGTMAHEFLLFSGDRGAILATVRYALALAESHNSGYQNDEAIGNATVDEYTGYHDSWANLSRVGCPESCVDHDVDPGNTFLFWFVVNTPGTYFFACHQVDRTDWKVHQDKGMWGTLIVDA